MKQMKKKILVVEDNLLLSGILRKWLKQADYEVLTAGDEPTARKLICKCSPDLILSDIRLPVAAMGCRREFLTYSLCRDD